MIQLYIIGTLHLGYTPLHELEEEIGKINPDMIGVEICQKDINNNSIESYPPETQHMLKYAQNNNITYFGFDSHTNTFNENIDVKEIEKELIEEQLKIVEKYSWKEFNNTEIAKLLNTSKEEELIDSQKFKQRQEEMIQNIKNIISNLEENTKVVIITGCGHLASLGGEFPNAKFPLRK